MDHALRICMAGRGVADGTDKLIFGFGVRPRDVHLHYAEVLVRGQRPPVRPLGAILLILRDCPAVRTYRLVELRQRAELAKVATTDYLLRRVVVFDLFFEAFLGLVSKAGLGRRCSAIPEIVVSIQALRLIPSASAAVATAR